MNRLQVELRAIETEEPSVKAIGVQGVVEKKLRTLPSVVVSGAVLAPQPWQSIVESVAVGAVVVPS